MKLHLTYRTEEKLKELGFKFVGGDVFYKDFKVGTYQTRPVMEIDPDSDVCNIIQEHLTEIQNYGGSIVK